MCSVSWWCWWWGTDKWSERSFGSFLVHCSEEGKLVNWMKSNFYLLLGWTNWSVGNKIGCNAVRPSTCNGAYASAYDSLTFECKVKTNFFFCSPVHRSDMPFERTWANRDCARKYHFGPGPDQLRRASKTGAEASILAFINYRRLKPVKPESSARLAHCSCSSLLVAAAVVGHRAIGISILYLSKVM